MTPALTMEVGKPAASRFGKFGASSLEMTIPPLNKLFGLVCGKPGRGKSALVQSCEGGLVINLDLSHKTTRTARAQIWPDIGADGQPRDVDGKPVLLSWESVQALVSALEAAAAAKQPRPDCIFFDSLTNWIGLLKDYLVRSGDKTFWQELDGRAAWDKVYETITNTCAGLHQAGYGVFVVCHIVEESVQMGDDPPIRTPELTITPNFYKRIYPLFDLVAAVDRTRVSTTRLVPQQPQRLPDGRTIQPPPKQVHETHEAYVFATDNEPLRGILKRRIVLPGEIVLPADDLGYPVNGWATVAAEYAKSAQIPTYKEPL